MKCFFAMMAAFALLTCVVAHAGDHSAAISADGSGIDLYAITDKGVELVKGSPYVLPQPGIAYPLPVKIVKTNSRHDFVYAVYWNTSVEPEPSNIMVVGLKITDRGLEYKWSAGYSFDPTQFYANTLSTGANYAVLYAEPMGLGHGAMIFQQSGRATIVGIENGPFGPLLTSAIVDENFQFYYLCYAGAQPPQVEVGELTTNKLLSTSTDQIFFASECPSN